MPAGGSRKESLVEANQASPAGGGGEGGKEDQGEGASEEGLPSWRTVGSTQAPSTDPGIQCSPLWCGPQQGFDGGVTFIEKA